MKKSLSILAGCCLLAATTGSAAPQGAAVTGRYPNLFKELLGKTDAEVDARVASTWRQLFHGDENSQRLFYPIPGGMAYIPDIAHHDVRTEGLSYGMMICVQLDHRKEFDEIWKFAKRYMYQETGPLRGYFTWHTAFDGSKLRDVGPAPDGEEWFVTALFFASQRWGDGKGIFDYGAEAQAILHAMLHKDEEKDRGREGNMIDRAAGQVDFTPQGPGAHFTDPSYHLPAFYELWARWAASPEDRAFLARLAPASRELFKRAANPRTGLMPDICGWDGQAVVPGRYEFSYDAWRTLSNPAVDWSWWAADPWEVEQSNRVLTFLASQGPDCPTRFKLDGTPLGTDTDAPGLMAMAASAALAANPEIARPFVERFWDMKVPTGRQRYYDGLLTMLATLELSGHFRIYAPPPGQCQTPGFPAKKGEGAQPVCEKAPGAMRPGKGDLFSAISFADSPFGREWSRLRAEAQARYPDLKLTAVEDLHVTVVYIGGEWGKGDLDRIRALASVAPASPVRLTPEATRMGAHGQVVVVELHGASAAWGDSVTAAKRTLNRLGLKKPDAYDANFRPHITLAEARHDPPSRADAAELAGFQSWMDAKIAKDPQKFAVAVGPRTRVFLLLAGAARPPGAPDYVPVGNSPESRR